MFSKPLRAESAFLSGRYDTSMIATCQFTIAYLFIMMPFSISMYRISVDIKAERIRKGYLHYLADASPAGAQPPAKARGKEGLKWFEINCGELHHSLINF